jgi:hypothetical protein
MTGEEDLNIEEEKIQDAEVEKIEIKNASVGEENAEIEQNKKKDFYVELVLLFILGVLIGIAIKTEASKKITMGFDDYQMKIARQDYNINQLQTDLTKKSIESAATDKSGAGQQNPDSTNPANENASGN